MTRRTPRPGRHSVTTGAGERPATPAKKGKKATEPEAPDLIALAKQWSELQPLTGSDSGMLSAAAGGGGRFYTSPAATA
jgi:hypothetical protein